jgi:hypothetical protein
MRKAVRSISALAGLVLALTVALSAFAADAVPTVEVTGVVLDMEGQPAEVDTARFEEFETPDSEPIKTPIDVAADGTFTVALREWGTPEEPALARFVVFAPQGEPVIINDEGCTEMNTPFGTLEVAIPGVVPTEPIDIVLDQTTEEGLCPPVTATPQPQAPAARGPSVTLPPTDAAGASRATPELTGAFAGLLFLAGTAALALAALVRRRAMGELSPRTVSSTRGRRPRGR